MKVRYCLLNEEACVPACSICQISLPVRRAAREGLQPGAAQKALLKRVPSFAMRSKFGVETIFDPWAEVWGKDWSSLIMIRMFGGVSAARDGMQRSTEKRVMRRIMGTGYETKRTFLPARFFHFRPVAHRLAQGSRTAPRRLSFL